MAYLAERVLDVEALKRLVDANPSPLDACAGLASSTWLSTSQPVALRALLARRLLRAEREREALRYFEGETRALAEKYVVALEAARAERAPLVRAAHWYEAAKVAREHGMELLGFEGPPGLRWTGGNPVRRPMSPFRWSSGGRSRHGLSLRACPDTQRKGRASSGPSPLPSRKCSTPSLAPLHGFRSPCISQRIEVRSTFRLESAHPTSSMR